MVGAEHHLVRAAAERLLDVRLLSPEQLLCDQATPLACCTTVRGTGGSGVGAQKRHRGRHVSQHDLGRAERRCSDASEADSCA